MSRLCFLVSSLLLAVVITDATAIAADSASAKNLVTVHPRQIDDLLANPGMGWQTFHQFVNHDKNLAGLPTSSAYYRFYWSEIEPRHGEPDFKKIDGLLAHGRRHGQKLAIRVMVVGSGSPIECPAWLKEAGCRGTEYKYGGKLHWFPDFADPLFQEKHFAVIRALGKRYDGHPDLDLVDIGSVGMWGEWNMAGVTDPATGKGVPLPPESVQNAIIDEWKKAFPETPKVVLIGSDPGMMRAEKESFGWRADCFGDLGGFSKNWNHMNNIYPSQIKKGKVDEVWKTAPVALESCWDMRKWKEQGWSIRDIFDYGLDHHASYLNNKSAPLPEGTREEVERFLRKLGYRLVIRELEHPGEATAGQKLKVSIDWENVGVAPPYRDYFIALQLRDASDKRSKPIYLHSDQSVRGWLPGKTRTEVAVELPTSVSAGEYQLLIGLVEPRTNTPAIRLAIEGRDSEGWYPMGKIDIVAP